MYSSKEKELIKLIAKNIRRGHGTVHRACDGLGREVSWNSEKAVLKSIVPHCWDAAIGLGRSTTEAEALFAAICAKHLVINSIQPSDEDRVLWPRNPKEPYSYLQAIETVIKIDAIVEWLDMEAQ